jgi:fused signal recognition particle receptor
MIFELPELYSILVVWVAVALVGAAAGLVLGLLFRLVVRRRGARPAAGPEKVAGGTPWVNGLARTRGGLVQRLFDSWHGPQESDEWLAEVEAVLLGSDVGVRATHSLLERLRGRLPHIDSRSALKAALRDSVRDILTLDAGDTGPAAEGKPRVVLVVGVNGVGKTTTIGKLAHRERVAGRKVLVVAGDTFRAAAGEQLAVWASRVGAEIVRHQEGGDPSAVAHDGVVAARARGIDVVFIDTAGRLHVKAHLMKELEKMARTVGRQVEGAPHEVLLVIDATTGQNALVQARVFHEAIPLTGVILTKLDGTAKGGIALAIRQELGLPIRYVGLGEKAEDLVPFDADQFVAALFDEDRIVQDA